MKTIYLDVFDHALIPDRAKEFFPQSEDGIAYIQIYNRFTPEVEFCQEIYADSHPWKNYMGQHHMIEVISRKQAANIIRSVRGWNRVAKARTKLAKQHKEEARIQLWKWIDSLPDKILGYQRLSSVVIDHYGTDIVDLEWLAGKSLQEIEVIIQEIQEGE
jgi:hypothetical protein